VNYPCPICGAVCTLSEPPFQGGTTYECRCGASVAIPLYCPTCFPPAIGDKEFLDQTPAGDLQGQSFRCAEGHTFSVPWRRDGSHTRLTSFGTRIGDYDQMEQVGHLEAPLGAAVSKGFCSGVALDWIRRALLGRKADPGARKTNPELMAKKPRHLARAATARILLTSDRAQGFVNAGLTTRKEETEAQNQRATADAQILMDLNFDKYQRALDEINNQGRRGDINQQAAEERAEEAGRLFDQVEAEIQGNLKVRLGRNDASLVTYQDRSQVDRLWEHFARSMDEHLVTDRRKRGKGGPSERPFSDLRIVKSVDTREWEGVGQLCDLLVNDVAPNCAAYVSLRPALGTGDGHGVAILRTNAGVYQLFEPNLGAYEFQSAKSLSDALKFLFREVNNFEFKGRLKAAYTIFQGREAPVPGVKALVLTE
jgi:Yersinia/Haemophilus virulence surface antigen